MRLNNILEKPIVTEKSVNLSEEGRYTFKVNNKASKNAIAKAINDAFGVNVVNVKTVIMPGKKRRIRGTSRFLKTKKWKKAIVSLKEGQKIELFAEGK